MPDKDDTGNVWLDTVVPVLGGVVAMALFGSPMKAVWQARQRGAIDKLNLLPFIFIVANCISWVAYAYVIDNWYLFVPNTLGMLIGLGLFLVSFGIGVPDVRQRDQLSAAALALGAALPVVGVLERIVYSGDVGAGQQIWGYTANAVLFMFYLSPLSTLLDVLRHRDSSSLVLPLCAMNVANGTLWLVYGLVRADPFIWVPNGVGAVLGVLQTALCLVFPRRPSLGLPQTSAGSDQQLTVSSSSDAVLLAARSIPSALPDSGQSDGKDVNAAADAGVLHRPTARPAGKS